MWQCQWEKMKKQRQDIKDFVQSLSLTTPINPQDAFFGGRTGATTLYHRVDPTQREQIRYVDGTSEYPWVNKYGEYPVGHPTIYLEPENQDLNAYYGLMKIDILPPIHRFNPVLPYRQNFGPSSKLTFPLCRSCVEEESIKPIEDRNYICIHSDEERMLRGTWCTPEMHKAIAMGYRLIKIHERQHGRDGYEWRCLKKGCDGMASMRRNSPVRTHRASKIHGGESSEIIKTGLDHILPIQSRRVHSTEPPWIASTLKDLIQARQRALSRGDNQQFRGLRNRVNRERKACRAKHFQAKVEHLKECRPSAWWDEIKKLSGSSPAFTERSYVTKSLQHLYEPSDDISLANTINKAFLLPMQCFSPLPADFFIIPSDSATQQPALVESNESVYNKLTKLNRSKAHGPDGIPGSVLKENSDLLAAPIGDILNLSYREGRLPHSWKEGDVVSVPKQRPVQHINKHLRPISLTPILSKIAEEYVVYTYVKPAVLSKIDPQQFGTVPKSSTTHALISIIHSWAKSTDGNGSTTRVVLFDFRKAFNLIDHHVLARKLSSYDIPRPILRWIMDFSTNRKQRIKLSRDCFSEWEAVPAGVPQGTKLGPWLFLIMINNLSVADTIIWKYVDDTTLVESVLKNGPSYLQLRVNELVKQSEVDGFQFNESKCKELRISFSRSGGVSITAPVYISEIAPWCIRGRLVTVYSLFLAGAELVAAIIDGISSPYKKTGWRFMFGLAAVPSAIMFLGCLWLPESPSWLVSRGTCEDARKVLVRLRGTTDVNEELQAIQTVCKEEESFDKKSRFYEMLTTSSTREALLVGCMLITMQELSGINIV
ncbi:Proton myo-inositol cotransporter, partial [Stylophora pistillata]